jgi:uncharacterized protein
LRHVPMSNPKPSAKIRNPGPSAGTTPRGSSVLSSASAPPTVSGRWLLGALAVALAAALLCAWGSLCLLFWQGNWQLLYHPASAVTRTPASVNLQFDSVGFATDASGVPQLRGWWIAAAGQARYTALYLHGADGNLTNAVPDISQLHGLGINVFAFDYRGYGQSHFVHPGEARWREDAEFAIRYLTGTRHIAPGSLILAGKDLGANLALETAAAHPDLAGVVLENPLASPTMAIFNDARSRMVPAHLLVSDRWDTVSAASNLLIPSLWLYWTADQRAAPGQDSTEAYQKTPARKTIVRLTNSPKEPAQFNAAITGWLDQLPVTR